MWRTSRTSSISIYPTNPRFTSIASVELHAPGAKAWRTRFVTRRNPVIWSAFSSFSERKSMSWKTSPTTLRRHALNPDRSRGESRVAPVAAVLEEEPGAAEACAGTTEAGKSETITISARTVSVTTDHPTSVHRNPDRRAIDPTVHRVGGRPNKTAGEDDNRVAPTLQIDAVGEETIGLELHSRQRSWGRSVHFG